MKINKFDKTTVNRISAEVKDALKPIAEKYGLNFVYKGGTYSDSNFVVKVEFAVIADNGVVMRKEAQAFLDNAEMIGFKEEDLGAEFTVMGRHFKIIGLRDYRAKFPLIVTDLEKQKNFVIPVEQALNALGRKLNEGYNPYKQN